MQTDSEDQYSNIVNSITGDLSAEEKQLLEEWRRQSEENDGLFLRLSQTAEYADRLRRMRSIDTNAGLKALRSRIAPLSPAKIVIRFLRSVAAVLFIPLLLGSIFLLNRIGEPANEVAAAIMKETETAFGIRTQLTLSDGTIVWLNSGSKLIYPETFGDKTREVTLSGEAMFQVVSNVESPFIVNAGPIKVKATGTVFNVTNYANEPNIEVILDKGAVSLHLARDVQHPKICDVAIGEMATYHRDENRMSVKKVDTPKFLAWTQGRLIFRNDKMEEVVTRLGRWYNADIVLEGEEITDYFYTATFDGETIGQILELLKHSAPIDYYIIPRSKKSDNTFARQQITIKTKKKTAGK